MKYLRIPLILLVISLMTACEDDVELLSIERSGRMRFNVNGEEWVASNFRLNAGPLVVVNLDSSDVGRSFRRYALIGQGVEPSGRRFQVSYIFDLSAQENFVGVYNRNYTFEKGGLAGVTLNVETGYLSNYYTTYKQSSNVSLITELKINAQSSTERLVLGTFRASMQRDVDSTQVFTIDGGFFEDVSY